MVGVNRKQLLSRKPYDKGTGKVQSPHRLAVPETMLKGESLQGSRDVQEDQACVKEARQEIDIRDNPIAQVQRRLVGVGVGRVIRQYVHQQHLELNESSDSTCRTSRSVQAEVSRASVSSSFADGRDHC